MIKILYEYSLEYDEIHEINRLDMFNEYTHHETLLTRCILIQSIENILDGMAPDHNETRFIEWSWICHLQGEYLGRQQDHN